MVSGVLAMSTILHALIASVKGAGTLTGEFHYLINGLACLLYRNTPLKDISKHLLAATQVLYNKTF